jgi:cytochrome c oxidase subunit 4
MSHETHTGHIASQGLYFTIFAALMLLTALTVGVTYVDLGEANLFVAMGIAITKATLVVLFFMHLRWSSRLTHVAVIAALVFLAILASFTFADYLTRGMMGVAGR